MKVYMVLEHEPLEEAVQRVIDELPETPTLYATREQAEEAARKYNAEFHDPEPAVAVEVDVIEPIDRKSTKTRDARSRNRHHAGKDSQAKASSTAIRKHVGG